MTITLSGLICLKQQGKLAKLFNKGTCDTFTGFNLFFYKMLPWICNKNEIKYVIIKLPNYYVTLRTDLWILVSEKG